MGSLCGVYWLARNQKESLYLEFVTLHLTVESRGEREYYNSGLELSNVKLTCDQYLAAFLRMQEG